MSGEGPDSIPTSADPRSRRPTKKRALHNATSTQAASLDALFAKPDQEIRMPPPPLPSSSESSALGRPRLPPPPEIVTNVQGSSAGAGSGEFHVYKASRRREYERLRQMDDDVRRERDAQGFEAARRERESRDDARTRKNREKRARQKARSEKNKNRDKDRDRDEEAATSAKARSPAQVAAGADGASDAPSGKNEKALVEGKPADGTDKLKSGGAGRHSHDDKAVDSVSEAIGLVIHDDD